MEANIRRYSKEEFKEGVKAGIPIFMGYFPISITFGLIAKSSGISGGLAVLVSMLNFTGATQFIGVNMISQGMSLSNIVLTTFMINARYLLMSFCMANKLKSTVGSKAKALLSFGVTDEVFVVSMTKENLNQSFVLGTEFISYAGWALGTFTGVVLASILPESITKSIGIAIYIMFIALLLPAMKGSLKVTLVAIIAMLISSLIYWIPILNKLIGNWRIIISIIIASLIGAKFMPQEEGETYD